MRATILTSKNKQYLICGCIAVIINRYLGLEKELSRLWRTGEKKVEKSKTWDDIPHTNPKATVKAHREAVDVLAICVEKASVREATVSGWFEVADSPNPFTYERGSLTVEVKCHWYGLKPEKEWMHLRISNKYQLIRRFSGDVMDNIE